MSEEQDLKTTDKETSPPTLPEDTKLAQDSKEKDDNFQIEPTQEEMERERLMARAEQLQDEIETLRSQLVDKENELAGVKEALGITPFTEFRQSIAHGFKVMGDKLKEMQDTETYQKMAAGGRRVQEGFSAAGNRIRENETLKNMGAKTSDAFSRAGTKLRETANSIKDKFSSSDHDAPPTDKESVVPDEPTTT